MKFFRHGIVFAKNDNKSNETDVPQGLAYTPAEMLQKTQRGSSISLDSLAPYAEYDTNESMRLDIENVRGTDFNDAWEASVNANEKLSSAHRGMIKELSKKKS